MIRLRGLILIWATLLSPNVLPKEHKSGVCSQTRPLSWSQTSRVQESETPTLVSEWRLPISPERPDLITAAHASVRLISPSGFGPWRARIDFTFNDPKPYGIPFSFLKFEVFWRSDRKTYHAQVDWSHDCGGPGRSMFPRQAWSETLELINSDGTPQLEDVSLFLWGSRN